MYVNWILIGVLGLVTWLNYGGVKLLEERLSQLEDDITSNQKAFREIGEEVDKLWDQQH